MTDIRLYIVELESNKRDEATLTATKTAGRLQTKDLKLVELIESLGEYLNHGAPLTRERGIIKSKMLVKVKFADRSKQCPFSLKS
jgi:DNA repair/transcription protein MET18/MMS19